MKHGYTNYPFKGMAAGESYTLPFTMDTLPSAAARTKWVIESYDKRFGIKLESKLDMANERYFITVLENPMYSQYKKANGKTKPKAKRKYIGLYSERSQRRFFRDAFIGSLGFNDVHKSAEMAEAALTVYMLWIEARNNASSDAENPTL